MPTSIDWPLKHPQRRRRRFFILLAVLAVIVFGGRTAVSYFVDLLWFRSLGYGSVFSKTLALQWSIFALFAAATFLILYGSFAALKRTHLPDLPSSHTIFFGGQPVRLPVEPVMRLLGFRRIADHRPGHGRGHDGGMADARALLVRTALPWAALSTRSSVSR